MYDWLLVNRDGLIISSGDRERPLPVKAEAIDSVRAVDADSRQFGFVEERHLRRQVPVLTGYAKTRGYAGFPGLNWTVLIRLDRDQAYAPIDRLVWLVGGVGLLVIAPLTGFAVWVSWRLVREPGSAPDAAGVGGVRRRVGTVELGTPAIRLCRLARPAGTAPHGGQLHATPGEALQG